MSESLLVLGSPLFVDDSEFYLVGEKVIFETSFQEELPGLLSLDTIQDILSVEGTGKILLELGTLSVKALGRLSLDTG